jgi:hypothetical protein
MIVGNYWIYKTLNETRWVEVTAETLIQNTEAIILSNNAQNEYYTRHSESIKKLHRRSIYIGGDEYLVENHWLTEYREPFILGNSFTDSVVNIVEILGETWTLRHYISKQVVELDTLSTPAGKFNEVYRINFIEKVILNSESTYAYGSVYLAPGVGIVKKISNGVEEVLWDYRIQD